MVPDAYARPSRPSLSHIGIPDEIDELAIQIREQRQAHFSRQEQRLEASTSAASVAASDTQRIMLPAPMMLFGVVANTAHDLLYVGARFGEEANGRGAYAGELDILG